MFAAQAIKNFKAIESDAENLGDYTKNSDESKIMNALVDEYCAKWIGTRKKMIDSFKNDTVELLANVHREYIAASIKNEVCGPNLHSQFVIVMDEFRMIKQQINTMRESEEISKKMMQEAQAELKEQMTVKKVAVVPAKKETKTVSSPKKVSGFAPFISQKAKDFADENGIKAEDVEGTGKDNGIKITDIRKVMKGSTGATAKVTKASKASALKKTCCGVSKSGAPCGSSGSVSIRGAWFCKKHQSQGDDIVEKLEEENYEEYDEDKDKIVQESSFSSQFRELSISSSKSMTKADLDTNAILGDTDSVGDDDIAKDTDSVGDDDIAKDTDSVGDNETDSVGDDDNVVNDEDDIEEVGDQDEEVYEDTDN
jgi:hypothetical protein